MNSLSSVLAENCTPCLFRNWKTFYHHSVKLYSLLACVVCKRHTMAQINPDRYLNSSVLAAPPVCSWPKNTLPLFSQLYSLLACVVVFRTYHGPIKKPTVIWTHQYWLRTAPRVYSGTEKHFTTILSSYTAFLHVLCFKDIPWVIQPSCMCCGFYTYHGQIKPHRYLKTLPSVLLKNTLPLFSQLYSLLACVVFLRQTMAQIKPHRYLNILQYWLSTAPPVCSEHEKHFATILSLIQPSCMCCGF